MSVGKRQARERMRGLSVLVTGLHSAFETKRYRNAEITSKMCPYVRSHTFTGSVAAAMVLHETGCSEFAELCLWVQEPPEK